MKMIFYMVLALSSNSFVFGSQPETIQQRAQEFRARWEEDFTCRWTSSYNGIRKQHVGWRDSQSIDARFKAGILSHTTVFLELYAERTKAVEKQNELLAQLLVKFPASATATQPDQKAAKEPLKDATK